MVNSADGYFSASSAATSKNSSILDQSGLSRFQRMADSFRRDLQQLLSRSQADDAEIISDYVTFLTTFPRQKRIIRATMAMGLSMCLDETLNMIDISNSDVLSKYTEISTTAYILVTEAVIDMKSESLQCT